MSEFTINANFNYSVKVPSELKGGPQYGSEEFGGSLTISQVVEAASPSEAQEAGRQLLPFVAQTVKVFVLNQAGLEAVTDGNGVINPVFPKVQAQPVAPRDAFPQWPQQAAPMQQMNPVAQQYHPQGNSAEGRAGFDQQGQPTWEGRPVKVYDNRSQVGTAAHGNKPHINVMFLDVDQTAPNNVKYQGFWANNKDGSPSKMYQEVLKLVGHAQGGGQAYDEAPF